MKNFFFRYKRSFQNNILNRPTDQSTSILLYRSFLVPVFAFGQNDSFHIPTNLEFLKSYKNGRTKLEKWLKVFIRNTLITFCGKYKGIPALPFNKPITVVGKKLTNHID